MRLTRAAFLAVMATALVTGGAALAERGGNGGGRGNSKKKVVVNGSVLSVDGELGTFVLHRQGGRGNGRGGSDVTVVTDDNTVFIRSDEAEGSFEDLAEGVKAQAKGKLNENGTLQAARVLVKVEDETEE